ncbi:MAG TPA: hypothetical protein VIQ27_01925, partial [Gemmatimonadales bacterium]
VVVAGAAEDAEVAVASRHLLDPQPVAEQRGGVEEAEADQQVFLPVPQPGPRLVGFGLGFLVDFFLAAIFVATPPSASLQCCAITSPAKNLASSVMVVRPLTWARWDCGKEWG